MTGPTRSVILGGILGPLVVPFLAATAAAEGPYEGEWRAGTTQVSVTVKSWGEDCGERPRSDTRPGGGIARITQRGPHLFIHGRGRTLRTDACWSPNRAMRRVSSSILDDVWTVRCATSSDDPKKEHGEYTLRAESADRLLYLDESHYDWDLNESKCVAHIITTQTLTRATDKRAAPPETLPPEAYEEPAEPLEPEPPAEPELLAEPELPAGGEACQPGEPVRIAIRPKRVEIQPAQRVCFRARVTDAADCPVPEPDIQWSLRHAPGLRGQLKSGCFRAAESAAEAEGEFRVLAEIGAARAQAVVAVKPIDLSGLIARRIEGGAVSGFDAEKEPGGAKSESAEKSSTRKVQVQPRSGFDSGLLLVGIAVAAVGVLVVVFWIRRRSTPADFEGVLEESASANSAPADEGARVDGGDAAAGETDTQWICPTCRRGYTGNERICPKDATELVPYEKFARKQRAHKVAAKQKRCPKCGATYPATIAFCSEDGSTLEVLD
jgi:hypothetical protein